MGTEGSESSGPAWLKPTPKPLATQAGGRVNKKLLKGQVSPLQGLEAGLTQQRCSHRHVFGSGLLGRTRGVGWGKVIVRGDRRHGRMVTPDSEGKAGDGL